MAFAFSPGKAVSNQKPVKKIEKWQTWTFVGSLAFLAVLIHASQAARQIRPQDAPSHREFTTEAQKTAPVTADKPRGKTPEELAAERAHFIAKYVTGNAYRNTGAKAIGIAVASESGKLNGSLATFLASRFTSPSVKTFPSLFTSEFVSDGLLAEMFSDSRSVVSKLDLAKTLDVVLLARQSVEYSSNPSLENVITANMSLELMAAPTATSGQNRTWTFTAAGAGFKQSDARQLAEERLMKQIANANISDTITTP